MGWASASEIFNRVAHALVANPVPDRTVTDVCAALIDELTAGDWDTLDESIHEFRDAPAVLAAFRRAAPSWIGEEAPADPEDASVPEGQIRLILRVEGETTVDVDRAEYEQAKADGEAGQFLDYYLSDLAGDDTVIEPDGRSYDPSSQPYGPTSDAPTPA